MTQELKAMDKSECEWKLVQRRRSKDRKGTNGQRQNKKEWRDDERKKRGGQHPATTRLQSATERLSIHETLKTGVRRG
jgi:hypothetical protein